MARKKAVDRSGDAAAQKTGRKEVDSVRVFAEKLRDHKSLESRWAVLHEARVEYFRGKDLVAVLRDNPDLKSVLRVEPSSNIDEEALGNLLLRRKLVVRCDRVVKTVRPGKKKLSKWPARIELYREQVFSEDDAFFAWTFERRRPMWQIILSILLPFVTVSCCLFPIFPHWCKLGVLYFCLTFLALIFGILFVRWAIFGSILILFGRRFWIFPNILAEEASLTDLIKFWPEKNKDEDPPPKKTTRLAFALLTAASVWVCIHHAPDEAARSRYQKKVSNIIDEVLVWKPNLSALSSRTEGIIIVNETLHNNTESDGVADVSEGRPSEHVVDLDGDDVVEGEDVVGKSTSQSLDGLENDLIEDSSLQEGSTSELEDVI